jgi:hypothetical protein
MSSSLAVYETRSILRRGGLLMAWSSEWPEQLWMGSGLVWKKIQLGSLYGRRGDCQRGVACNLLTKSNSPVKGGLMSVVGDKSRGGWTNGLR